MQSSKKKSLSDQRGFTLLEMLIVISIAGVLAAVAVPRFNNAIIMANTSRVQADLQVLNSAIVMYQAENGKYPLLPFVRHERIVSVNGESFLMALPMSLNGSPGNPPNATDLPIATP